MANAGPWGPLSLQVPIGWPHLIQSSAVSETRIAGKQAGQGPSSNHQTINSFVSSDSWCLVEKKICKMNSRKSAKPEARSFQEPLSLQCHHLSGICTSRRCKVLQAIGVLRKAESQPHTLTHQELAKNTLTPICYYGLMRWEWHRVDLTDGSFFNTGQFNSDGSKVEQE